MVSRKRISSRILRPLKQLVKPSPYSDAVIMIDQIHALVRDKPTVIDTWRLPHASIHTLHESIARSATDMTTPLDSVLKGFVDPAHTDKHHPVQMYPFTSLSDASGTLWHHGTAYMVYVKGAPEKILHYCDLTDNEREQIHIALHKHSSSGHTVIALAHGTLHTPVENIADIPPASLTFDGLVILSHPIVVKAKQAIAKLTAAGAAIILVTGSHVETAYRIGKATGIVTSRRQVIDSRHLHLVEQPLSHETLQLARIFARADDDSKQAIIKLFHDKRIITVSSSAELYALTTK